LDSHPTFADFRWEGGRSGFSPSKTGGGVRYRPEWWTTLLLLPPVRSTTGALSRRAQPSVFSWKPPPPTRIAFVWPRHPSRTLPGGRRLLLEELKHSSPNALSPRVAIAVGPADDFAIGAELVGSWRILV